MSSINLKNDFIEWMRTIKKRDGKKYKETTVKGYSDTLSKACAGLKNIYLDDIDLFNINSSDKLKLIEKKIRSAENFKVIDKNYGNGQLSAGLGLYYKYLIYLEKNEMPSEEISVVKENKEEYFKDYINDKQYNKYDFLLEVFISEQEYETIKSLLYRKKNLILQGSPGVGKTFAAKRLAYSLMGEKDNTRITVVQFHQSYSYEDFIMGYRPCGNGFELKLGPFYNFCREANSNPDEKYFFIIDEINRGNMSKIFGELLMLIENDKRGESISLTYDNMEFNVPDNVYIIGMMNTADRSLAIIDYALRRRFCFYEMKPAFNSEGFKNYLLNQGASIEIIDKIIAKISKLNSIIRKDNSLGKGFEIGHSYFCNYYRSEVWFDEIIRYEIEPLIKEYWFDDEEKAETIVEELLG